MATRPYISFQPEKDPILGPVQESRGHAILLERGMSVPCLVIMVIDGIRDWRPLAEWE